MNDSLIIDARLHLHWQRRLFSDASTAMLWGCWLWLWRPLLSIYAWTMGLGVGLHATMMKLPALGASLSVENSAVALFSTSSTLLLWKFLSTDKVQQVQARPLRDYATHFGLPEQDIRTGRSSSVCVVHHDAQGRIVRIEKRA